MHEQIGPLDAQTQARLGAWAEPHACHCRDCDPSLPSGGRQSEGHVAVRFGDAHRGRWVITLNGQEVQNSCTEAIGGKSGTVVLMREPKHRCGACNRAVCEYAETGAVHVEHREWGVPDDPN